MYDTFWKGGGSLKFSPGSVMTSLIWPSAYTTPNWRWSTTKSMELSSARATSSEEAIKPILFMVLFSFSAFRGHGCASRHGHANRPQGQPPGLG
jgi:hypothetical protein